MKIYKGGVGPPSQHVVTVKEVPHLSPEEKLLRAIFGEKASEEARLLNPRFDLANHSPDGFNWGYGGSGPSQLALALLADALEDDARALRLYQNFNRLFVQNFGPTWEISSDEIDIWADYQEEEAGL